MDAFSYLSVLLSIVLGLAITQLLGGFAALVRARHRVKMYWPVPVQMAVVFLLALQLWWALFPLNERRHWTFATFLIVLMQPVMVYLMAAFITPDVPPSGEIELRAGYFRETRWFFGSILVALGVSIAKSVMMAGTLPVPADLVGHAAFAAVALTGFFSRNSTVHKVLAPASLLFYATYIALLFVTLPQ
ncbi:MAG TPA: hypothetical protein VHW02_12365 [Rhizomicrobium sp.]|jgi:hypothetical protein|nr:hypothetical protein [Rhizomicrobium sp.]